MIYTGEIENGRVLANPQVVSGTVVAAEAGAHRQTGPLEAVTVLVLGTVGVLGTLCTQEWSVWRPAVGWLVSILASIQAGSRLESVS